MDQFLAWFDFPEYRRAMQETGCRIMVYDVFDEAVKIGMHQVIFRKECGRVIETLDIPV
jgi:hypothetical protein